MVLASGPAAPDLFCWAGLSGHGCTARLRRHSAAVSWQACKWAGQVCLLLPVLSGALAQGLGLAILTVVLASFLYDIRSLHAQAERQP